MKVHEEATEVQGEFALPCIQGKLFLHHINLNPNTKIPHIK